jgi:hypothetical protein
MGVGQKNSTDKVKEEVGVSDTTVGSLDFIRKQEQQNIESVPDKPDLKSTTETLKIQLAKLELDNQDLRQNINLRRKYALALFILLSIWLTAILTIIFFSGFKLNGFELSETTQITLITTTTGMVVGFFVGVTNYLFPTKKNNLP